MNPFFYLLFGVIVVFLIIVLVIRVHDFFIFKLASFYNKRRKYYSRVVNVHNKKISKELKRK